MSERVTFTEVGEQLVESPIVVRLWSEGKRVVEVDAIAIEYDGDEVEIFTEEGDQVHDDEEFDELTVQYSP